MYINTSKFYSSDNITQIRLGKVVITYRLPTAGGDRRWLTFSTPKRTISLCATTANAVFLKKFNSRKVTHFKFLFIGGWYRREV